MTEVCLDVGKAAKLGTVSHKKQKMKLLVLLSRRYYDFNADLFGSHKKKEDSGCIQWEGNELLPSLIIK